jgi:N-acetylmuramoyl-L-alanine amidase
MYRLLLGLFIFTCSVSAWASGIDNIRLSQSAQKTRIVFDLSDKTNFTTFLLDKPYRLVIDLKGTKQSKILKLPSFSGTPIQNIRYAQQQKNTLRVVLDLKKSLKYTSQTLAPSAQNSHRIVIDLTDKKHVLVQPNKTIKKIASPTQVKKPQIIKVNKTIKSMPRRDIIIAIDAGHGGKDSGAIGKRGTKEKDIVLAIARKLAKLVSKEPGMRAYLTRNNDTFISLRQRIKRARAQKADMFISIHADAFHKRAARGASVFVLSERGASSEAAQMLADKENAADLVGGISLEDKDDLLASVLLDLSQTASLEASLEVAETVLSGLKRVGHTHKKQVESAAFVVLKSPDIPSILVETAFISNPAEERKLRSSGHQKKLALAMMSGIRNYFQRNPPLGTQTPQQHIVSRGDTLSTIAQRYQVSLPTLKSNNGLMNSRLNIGDILIIP